GRGINGPWDMTSADFGRTADLFVTNVLNGTVAAKGKTVHLGTVVRILLVISPGRLPFIARVDTIGSGFGEHLDPAALVIGPTAPSTSWTTPPTPSPCSTSTVVAAPWSPPGPGRPAFSRCGRWSGVQDDEGGDEAVRGAAGVDEAFDVLDQEDVARAEGTGLAGRGDLDA